MISFLEQIKDVPDHRVADGGIMVLNLAIFLGRNDDLRAALFYVVAYFIAVIAAICQDGGGFLGAAARHSLAETKSLTLPAVSTKTTELPLLSVTA